MSSVEMLLGDESEKVQPWSNVSVSVEAASKVQTLYKSIKTRELGHISLVGAGRVIDKDELVLCREGILQILISRYSAMRKHIKTRHNIEIGPIDLGLKDYADAPKIEEGES